MSDLISRQKELHRCRFCEAMKVNRNCDIITRTWITDDDRKKYGNYMKEYSVAIVKRSWYSKMGKKHAGRTVEFRRNGLGFALNYCPECGTAIMKDEYEERARKIAVFLSTEIKWYDRLERMPDEVSGRFFVLMITGNVLTCDYYNGHWNATESYIGSAFEPQDVIAWAEIPKELTELARKRWKEVYE